MYINDDLKNDLFSNPEPIDHLVDWCSTDALYDNTNAITDVIGNPIVHAMNNIWFRFRATETSATISVSTGGAKGTMSSPVIHLTDDIVVQSPTVTIPQSPQLKQLRS